jgi:hypothetical protein
MSAVLVMGEESVGSIVAEGSLPLSSVISRSGSVSVIGSRGVSMLYRAYCSCAGTCEQRSTWCHTALNPDAQGHPGDTMTLCG